jgi:site-specific recombinase XerC
MEFNCENFLEHLSAVKGYSAQTVKAYRSDLKLITMRLREMGVKKARQINQRTVADLIQWMRTSGKGRNNTNGLADASIARRLAALSSYLDYIQATSDSAQLNPIKSIHHRWKRNREPKPVDDYILDLLLASIDNIRDRALFTLFLATGLRISEMYQLNRDSIEIRSKQDEFGNEHPIGSGKVIGKGGKRREFFVSGHALDVYAEYILTRKGENPALFLSERRQRMSVRSIEERLSAWCRKLGFSHINPHRLRHSYATKLANANIDSMVLKTLMGHSSFNTTQQYFKLTEKTLARGYFAAMEYVSQ